MFKYNIFQHPFTKAAIWAFRSELLDVTICTSTGLFANQSDDGQGGGRNHQILHYFLCLLIAHCEGVLSPSQSPFELRPCLVTQKSAKLSIGWNDPVISKLPNLYLHNILRLYWQRLQGKGRTRYKLYLKLIKDVRKQNCKDMSRSCNTEQRKSYKVNNESWKSTLLFYPCSMHTTNARLLITYLKIIKLNTYYFLMVCVTKMEILGKQTYYRK